MFRSACFLLLVFCQVSIALGQTLELKSGDHVSIIGNTTADRLQHHGWLETYIHALHPELELTFRNLAFPGDELTVRPREDNFGSPDQWLSKNQTDVIFAFFGYNEAFGGPDQLEKFRQELAETIDGMLGQQYNGESAPRIVFFSPIAHEDLRSRHLPDGAANNANLYLYSKAMRFVCEEKGVSYVDLFAPTLELYANAQEPLTMNGIHLLDDGNRQVAEVIIESLFGRSPPGTKAELERLRQVVLEKNYYWFSRYRVVDGYNVFGGRSKLAWFGQSNADVMKREMEIFDIMTANRDKRVWAVAQGGDLAVKDDNLPEQLVVRTNKEGDLPDGSFSYRSADEGLEKLEMAEGLQANVYASEEMFPELINPVQMAVDTDGRLFVSVWPSYPHWNPTEPRRDRILCLPDDNGDGVADRCVVFADGLNSVTGFEFWGGGMLVAALPELWFLKDTDGDGKADLKIRMLQGLSSADSHHSANAMVLGPDGWIYWSRGIFNVATMETPTRTYRSTRTGVHRFNPRTFEMEFHFPIGPNPHGDVFDRWGYQFANDGTSGTGSYVNIGKGEGNKQWFKKRVRPVAATGILSSSHFPDKHQNNFLICNCIGFLGVLQHEVKYNGADITCEEIEPILVSSDPNFRPTDVEIGSDGALYVSDWANALIGHMQHNMRDPNRDHEHGRIYRVTAAGRPLLEPVLLKGKPIAEVCEAFYAKENATRYRARIELSGRDSEEVAAALERWTADKDVADQDDAQALLECLWVHEEHRLPNGMLLKKVFEATEPRVRAAAIRTLGHWGPVVDGWQTILSAAARDESALVRAEAVKAAVEFEGAASAEAIFDVASRETDPELNAVLNYARQKIQVDALIADAVAKGKSLSVAARAYALQKASPDLLLKLDQKEDVYAALLIRGSIPAEYRRRALAALAKEHDRSEASELLIWIRTAEQDGRESLKDLARMLDGLSPSDLSKEALVDLIDATQTSAVRAAAYRAWIRSGDAKLAWQHAFRSRAGLTDLLRGVKSIRKSDNAAPLYEEIRPLLFELPDHLQTSSERVGSTGPAVSFEYYEPNPAKNVAMETLDAVKPKFTGRMESFATFVPDGRRDAFATRQTASIDVPANGEYTFYTTSDDGSRLYINERLVVNNDGLHGMSEKSGRVSLESGLHEIVLTYFENGGGDGLRVAWKGPGFNKQPITASVLRPAGSGNLQAMAIDALAGWPGKLNETIDDFARLVDSDSLQSTVLTALSRMPLQRVANQLSQERRTLVLDSLLRNAEKATPVQRQMDDYSRLLTLGDRLAAKLDGGRSLKLKELDVLRASIPEKADPKVMQLGREVYSRESHCATCHQPHGQGLPNLYPPLDGSLWVTGSEERLISLALDGMHGAIEVKGKVYSSPPLPPMTGFRQLLSDRELAAALTYVRNTWSNRAKPIEPEQVARVRAIDRGDATFWYAVDLLKKYPLEDGSLGYVDTGDRWIPKFVKKWTIADLTPGEIDSGKRSFEIGQLYFNRLGCAQCHKLGEKGGNFGPDLAKLDDKKRTADHVLQSILEPSKEIDDKYRMRLILTDEGNVVTGLVVEETDDALRLITDPLNPNQPTVVSKSAIDEESRTRNSIMPDGLVNWLQLSEIYDLAAFVLAAGDKDHAIYKE